MRDLKYAAAAPLALLVGATVETHTQSEAMPTFEVASIKPAMNPSVFLAKGVPNIEGAPGWLKSERYQIDATAAGAPSYAVMAGPMMQAVLEDRLKLKAPRDEKRPGVRAEGDQSRPEAAAPGQAGSTSIWSFHQPRSLRC